MKTRNLAAALLALGLSACAAEYSAVGIQAICAPPTPTRVRRLRLPRHLRRRLRRDAPCSTWPPPSSTFRLPFQINNLLVNNATASADAINTNDAFIQSFEITYAGASLEPWNVDRGPSRVPTAEPREPW